MKLIETSKLLTESEIESIVQNTLNRDGVKIKNVDVYGDNTVFGFLGEYFRLLIYLEPDSVS